jgi:choline/carnitine/betaine transport
MTVHDSPRRPGSTDPGSTPLPDPGAPVVSAEDRQPVDRWVFGIAAALVVAFIVWGVVSVDSLSAVSTAVLGGLMNAGGWAFVLVASAFVVFALWLAFSSYGKIPLGGDDEGPEFKTVSWIAMMFSAGMGIGLMFYGVGEPLSHFTSPPPGTVAPSSTEALDVAMATTLFHWTLHPWAIYAVVGLAIAYSTFRRGRRSLISSAFAPLLGEHRTQGPFGKFVDILAIFATLFGSAASLGLGALQIGAGLEANGLPPAQAPLLIGIIAVLTLAFVASAVSGVAKGIQWLSNINMVLAGVLALFVFVAGPTILILNLVPTAIGDYFGDLAEMAARTAATGGDATAEWLAGWTVFYWAWWISWTPFVGMFIARISRGRTIKQFIVGVLVIPSVVSLLWFAIFGGAAIQAQRGGTDLASASLEGQLFGLLHSLPLGTLMSILAMVLVAIFFVSGADAASVVTGTLSQHGSIRPSRWVVIFWGVVMGTIAAIMLAVGIAQAGAGEEDTALAGIRDITIISAAPFALVMVALCVALAKDLHNDPIALRDRRATAAVEQAVDHGTRTYGDEFVVSVKQAPETVEVAEAGSLSTSDNGAAAPRKDGDA